MLIFESRFIKEREYNVASATKNVKNRVVTTSISETVLKSHSARSPLAGLKIRLPETGARMVITNNIISAVPSKARKNRIRQRPETAGTISLNAKGLYLCFR